MSSEIQMLIREVKLLREDLAKFKQSLNKKEKEDQQWVTANVLIKMYSVNRRQLAQLRNQEVIKFRQIRPGVVRYLLSSAESLFNNKQAS